MQALEKKAGLGFGVSGMGESQSLSKHTTNNADRSLHNASPFNDVVIHYPSVPYSVNGEPRMLTITVSLTSFINTLQIRGFQ